MPRSLVVSSYPSAMLDALNRVHADGEVRIKTLTPAAMRLEFNGLRGALRKEGRGEIADQVSFHVAEGEFIMRLRSANPMIGDIEASLAQGKPSASDIEDVEASINRILGGF